MEKSFPTCNKDGTTSPASLPNKPLPAGTLLEKRYKIQKLIKSGGMGAVYIAEDKRLDNICAVKELLPVYGKAEEIEKAKEWFKREGELLAGLNHVGLPRVFDYFICNGRYYLVMTFIEGEDLETLLEKEGNVGLPEEKVLEIAMEILEILDYLHNRTPPVVYRDIKPANIMLHKSGRAILIDFGIARAIHEGSREKKTAVGTPGYAPAEQCIGKVVPQSDIYALGATMHHLLTGIAPVPFRFKPVKDILPGLSSEMEKIIIKALEIRPEDRFFNAKEMLKPLKLLEKKIKNVKLDWNDRGDTYFDNGNYKEAIKYYDRALEADLKDVRAWSGKGLSLHNLGKYKEALKCYDKALNCRPEYSLAWRSRGMALNSLKKYKEAIKCYDRASEIDPKDARAWNNKGVILNTLRNFTKALICYDMAIELNPAHVNAWNNRGVSLFNLGKIEESIKSFYKALEIDYKFKDARSNLRSGLKLYCKHQGNILPVDISLIGYNLCEIGKNKEGIEYYDIELEFNPVNTFALYNKGLALSYLGKYKEAIECYDNLIALTPENDMAFYNRGVAFFKLNNYEEAKKCYFKALDINFKNKGALLDLGFILERESKYEEALFCYERALEIDRLDAYAWDKKGYVFYNLNKWKEALECFNKALDIDPGDISARYNKELAIKAAGAR